MSSTPAPHRFPRRGQRIALALFVLAFLAGGVLSLAFGPDAGAVDLQAVDPSAGTDAQAATEAVTPADPDLERRLAEDVVAFVNSERRARSLPLLPPLDDQHARAANEVRLRDEDPGDAALSGYDAGTTDELFARLGTGTRTGEAVAGWVASDDGSTLLSPDASGIAVAAACQPGDRGGDLVLTVHVVSGESATAPASASDAPVADERPGAGRGEACQFADLATGAQARDRVVAPAALAAAGTIAIALALLEMQRRRHRDEIPGYVRVDRDEPPAPSDRQEPPTA